MYIFYRYDINLSSIEIKVISEIFNEITLRESCIDEEERILIIILKNVYISISNFKKTVIKLIYYY